MTRLIIIALLLTGCVSAQRVEDTAERECLLICRKPSEADCEQLSAFRWQCICRCDGDAQRERRGSR